MKSVIADAGVERSARALFGYLTGAWATQAVHVSARLGLADHIGDGVRTATELAALTDAHEGSLYRLLRFLASLGVVRSHGDGFGLTELGMLLRTDVPDSLHGVALLYGGLFYRSFGALEHGVQTGENPFAHVFGAAPFEYLAAHPEAAEVFHRAMAAGSAFFAAVPDAVDWPPDALVVDVGGGVGELLARLLAARPDLRGLLFEEPHVIPAASRKLGALGLLDRCRLVEGSFWDTVPSGGDVYILSRILHDWPDEQCRTILDNCRTAMDDTGLLLVLERPLCGASLASAWDINMMVNNVSGRERTVAEYEGLFAATGFAIRERRRLPLDMEVLVVSPRSRR